MVEAVVTERSQRAYSIEEYFELELTSEERHEFINGEIVPMTGGTPSHNQLSGNLYAALNFLLRRKPYQAFVTDQRLWIERVATATYPDVMVVAGELEFQPGQKDTITNPVFIAEALSTSTQNYDRTGKFRPYRNIPSFCEYVLMDQFSMHVERYRKTENNEWVLSEYEGAAAVLKLSSLEFEITLEDLYNKVTFE